MLLNSKETLLLLPVHRTAGPENDTPATPVSVGASPSTVTARFSMLQIRHSLQRCPAVQRSSVDSPSSDAEANTLAFPAMRRSQQPAMQPPDSPPLLDSVAFPGDRLSQRAPPRSTGSPSLRANPAASRGFDRFRPDHSNSTGSPPDLWSFGPPDRAGSYRAALCSHSHLTNRRSYTRCPLGGSESGARAAHAFRRRLILPLCP
ncbi:hypothetical protein Kpol_1019p25 [Vanderwaltozyma polyspora DSM 70294]|uniref:Uncharacterized protein n=1 Tax=Vanderwaltozyma polyspora (strain ATCC 22028 / DSM 70294 / BCRC 21397 / CBS 2163 / NBRC 10782 / NRRL Y-8283 / UCD 57-17) TaxID=436907 RepID=A7TPB8_VANPO|nr:uncharacterized protein Kpol_1019p25 [Vanderwaltozyma polyspora DSM 70294]EDO15905.1 hypothetical protein Kpol_1019p25 [Vanderwaltozyma polyspora DSM 70294]